MAAHGEAVAEASSADGGHLSIPLTIGAAVIAGLGILLVAYWLITFRWIYFGGTVLVAGGAYLLFTRATGPDHA
jgi:hypothetical protein